MNPEQYFNFEITKDMMVKFACLCFDESYGKDVSFKQKAEELIELVGKGTIKL
jgi:hypothetical protein